MTKELQTQIHALRYARVTRRSGFSVGTEKGENTRRLAESGSEGVENSGRDGDAVNSEQPIVFSILPMDPYLS